jgi:hypothetical protein
MLKLERVCIICGGVPDTGKTICVNCEDELVMLKVKVQEGREEVRL